MKKFIAIDQDGFADSFYHGPNVKARVFASKEEFHALYLDNPLSTGWEVNRYDDLKISNLRLFTSLTLVEMPEAFSIRG